MITFSIAFTLPVINAIYYHYRSNYHCHHHNHFDSRFDSHYQTAFSFSFILLFSLSHAGVFLCGPRLLHLAAQAPKRRDDWFQEETIISVTAIILLNTTIIISLW